MTSLLAFSQTPKDNLERQYHNAHSAFLKTLDQWDETPSTGEKEEEGNAGTILILAPEGVVVPKRTLVVYAYAHANWRLANFEHFLVHGLIAHSSDGAEVDYTFVVNGFESNIVDVFDRLGVAHTFVLLTNDTDATNLPPVVHVGARPRVLVIQRDNTGFDMCASKLVLDHGLAARSGTYTHVVLMNGSVRGPFMPSYVPFTWLDAFQNFLSNGVSLVGTTINCMSWLTDAKKGFTSLHMQSMVLALDSAGVRAVYPQLRCYTLMKDAISHGEIGSTQAVLAAGLGVVALQHNWHGYRIFARDLNTPELARRCAAVSPGTGGDPAYPGAYFGGEPQPDEVIFVKTNRNINNNEIERYSMLFKEFV
jgi:hypothetical protein